MKGHVLLGTWVYKGHSREFTEDGRCILRNGNDEVWTKRVVRMTKNTATLEGGYHHELKGDVLHIEGRYQAKKK